MKYLLLVILSLSSCAKWVDSKGTSACSVQTVPQGAVITCPNGDTTFVSNGSSGKDGKSCSVTQLVNGSKISCEDGTFGFVYNGEDGLSAPQGLMIKGYIYPCGNEFNNDEIFLRLTDGNIIAVYDGGNFLSRLVKLAPGNYITTDRTGSTCNVSINSNLDVSSTPRATTGEALR